MVIIDSMPEPLFNEHSVPWVNSEQWLQSILRLKGYEKRNFSTTIPF